MITYVSRNLEPVRGFHVFMRSLPGIHGGAAECAGRDRRRAAAHPAGQNPPKGSSWKSTFLDEIRSDIDLRRVHFLGRFPREQYRELLQVSSVRVYQSYPFVLSWSLLEAMSAGCAVIASDTAPLRDIISDGNGLLAPFFDIDALSGSGGLGAVTAQGLQANAGEGAKLREDNYDARRVCLPRMRTLVG